MCSNKKIHAFFSLHVLKVESEYCFFLHFCTNVCKRVSIRLQLRRNRFIFYTFLFAFRLGIEYRGNDIGAGVNIIAAFHMIAT